MCGIGAIINGNVHEIGKLMEPVKARGEADSFNEHAIIDSKVALSCNRLKIVDRANARQPKANEDKNIFVVFNGEIYNYKQLKAELESKGHIFTSDSDTEVLVHGYEEWRNELPKKLDGMFAFVIYDTKHKTFFAARDPFGIKPLHFAKQDNTVYFASELKQIVPFAESIQTIRPGHVMTEKGMSPYFLLPEKKCMDEVNIALGKIQQLFDEAVKKRVQTDLPIAVFLSGGIDSTAVLATARRFHQNVAAIIVGNEWESEESDASVALRYCKENNIPFVFRNPPSETELFAMVPEIVRITESFEPNMIKQSGFSLFLSKIAQEYGFKIVLCGEGSDEIFCGYPEFLKGTVDIQQLSRQFLSDLHRTQLQRVDRTSMTHTIEVRVPFLDVKLVEYVLNLPTSYKIRESTTKWILRQAMQDRLPPEICTRKKMVLSEGMGHKGNSALY